MNRIKKVKEYFKNCSPQFDIILREESWKILDYSVILSSGEVINGHLMPSSEGGIIKIAKRISDDKVFHQGDTVKLGEKNYGNLIEFKEDLINCLLSNDNGLCVIPMDEIGYIQKWDYEGIEGEAGEDDL